MNTLDEQIAKVRRLQYLRERRAENCPVCGGRYVSLKTHLRGPCGRKLKGTEMKCRFVKRASVHPSVVIGGASLGQCENEVVPGLVMCFEHADKEALSMLAQERLIEIEKLKARIADLEAQLASVPVEFEPEPGDPGYDGEETGF